MADEVAPDRFYVGRTQDLRTRFAQHNAGRIFHTTKWKPWRIKSYLALSNKERALHLERYFKSASGRAFAKKRL
ncbi:MAG: excinuclease ABC subunit C [Verrucomicrobia bacterium]|nr:MAG: excinuclease ABC subunit C [Verrucomicrobiota bacterium]